MITYSLSYLQASSLSPTGGRQLFEPRTVNKLVNERDEDSSVGL